MIRLFLARILHGFFLIAFRVLRFVAHLFCGLAWAAQKVDKTLGMILTTGIVMSVNKFLAWLVGIFLFINTSLLVGMGAHDYAQKRKRDNK